MCLGIKVGPLLNSSCVFGMTSADLKWFSCSLWEERQSHHPMRVCYNPPSLPDSLSVVFVSPLHVFSRRSFATVSIWKKQTESGRPLNTPYWLTVRYKEPLCLKVQGSRGCAVLSRSVPDGPFFCFWSFVWKLAHHSYECQLNPCRAPGKWQIHSCSVRSDPKLRN